MPSLRLIALIGAILLAGYPIDEMAVAAAGNARDNERGAASPPPTQSPASPAGEPRREATCRTIPSAGQASMHEDCAFIASQIPVLPSNTEREAHSGATVPSPRFEPGADIPSDVRDLKPLPAGVTQRLPQLRGYQYFLAGQDIVVVGNGAKIAFVIDVRIRP
jgi:hypothetical protein